MTGLNISEPAQMTGLNISEPSSVTFRTRTDDGQPCSSYPVVVEEEKSIHAREQLEVVDVGKGLGRGESASLPSIEDAAIRRCKGLYVLYNEGRITLEEFQALLPHHLRHELGHLPYLPWPDAGDEE